MRIPHIPKQVVLSTTVAGMALSLTGVAAYNTTQNIINSHIDFNNIRHLRFGSKGKEVHALQIYLYHHNYYSKKIDSLFGPHTQGALQAYQKDHQLNPTGVIDAETMKLLNIEFQKSHMDAHSASSHPTVYYKIGSRGLEVKDIQMALKRVGVYHGHIDGLFGKKTEQAVLSFQRSSASLKVDGIVGPNTKHILFNTHHVIKKTVVKAKYISPTHYATSNLISEAKQFLGTPYKWGGVTPSGFDCSGFLKYVFHKVGVNLPRTVNEIWNFAKPARKLSIGQIVFFQTYKPGPSHAGVYIGHHRFIHAGNNGVKISSLENPYWKDRYLGSKVLPN